MKEFLPEQTKLLNDLKNKADEYSSYLESVEVMSDNKLYRYYQKSLNEISEVALKYNEFCEIQSEKEIISGMLRENPQNSAELSEDLKNLDLKAETLVEQINELLKNTLKLSQENVQIEISSKQNSYEFVEFLKDIIIKFCEKNNFAIKLNYSNQSEISIFISGEGAYSRLSEICGQAKRTQRSNDEFATIVVLSLETPKQEFNDDEFEIQTFKSSGAGGQHINKTESAVRITHIPTNISVKCENERSQIQNKEKAKELIIEKLLKNQTKNQEKSIKLQRKQLQNAIFSTTPSLIFDFDKNEFIMQKRKIVLKLSEILGGKLPI